MKGLVLISSGIDSPVAAYLMKKQGVEIIGVHFNNYPYTDYRPLEKTKRLCQLVGIKKLYIVKHGLIVQKEIMQNTIRDFGCILCRRFMFRAAEQIAKIEGADFLITGENLGQVASQTLDNLIVCNSAVKIPILRPLLCYDKVETMALARQIGTYDTSILPAFCCKFVPQHPATRSTVEAIKKQEENLEVENLVKEVIKQLEIVDI